MIRPNMTANVKPHRVNAAGFSLIELMVTVVIVAILASIAIPSYNAQIRKSRRTDAKTALLDLAGREERYFSTNNGTYSTSGTGLGYATDFPVTIGSGYYLVSRPTVSAGTPTAAATFTIQAVPAPGNSQVGDTACQTFTIQSNGQQSATGSDPSANTDCWQ